MANPKWIYDANKLQILVFFVIFCFRDLVLTIVSSLASIWVHAT